MFEPLQGTVIFTESSPNLGGQELQLLQQMQALAGQGVPTLLMCRPHARIAQVARERGLRVDAAPFRNALDVVTVARVRRAIVANQACAVISHSGHDANLAALAVRTLRQPPPLFRMRTYLPGKANAYTCNRVFAMTYTPSAFLRDRVLANPDIHPDKVGVLYPGIDFARLDRDDSPMPGHVADWLRQHPGPVLVHGAMLRAEKGHDTLLAALPSILKAHPDVRYLIAGEGERGLALREHVRALGLQDHVYLAGMVDSVASLLRCATLAVLPSTDEPLGMFQTEALALSVPVIGSRVGGIPETVFHERTGLLAEPGNPRDWSDKINWALDHPELMHAWAKAGAIDVRARFSIGTNTTQLRHAIASCQR